MIFLSLHKNSDETFSVIMGTKSIKEAWIHEQVIIHVSPDEIEANRMQQCAANLLLDAGTDVTVELVGV